MHGVISFAGSHGARRGVLRHHPGDSARQERLVTPPDRFAAVSLSPARRFPIASPSARLGLVSRGSISPSGLLSVPTTPQLVPGVSGSPLRVRPVGPGRLAAFRVGPSLGL